MATILWKDLPYDVVVDILSRLPVKTLIRLRCVCKSWYAIITNPTFITMHINRQYSYNNNNNNYGYLQYLNFGSYSRRLVWCLLCDQTYDHQIELEIPFNHSPLLVGTVNGLICLSSNSHNFDYTICLWNPSIRKSKTLPSSSSTFPPPQFSMENFLVLGFGYHPQTNDYKIVRILYRYVIDFIYIANLPPPAEVYSLSSDSWRRIEALVPCYVSRRQSDAFFNGCVHWVGFRSVAHTDHRYSIMSFDIGGEVFGEMMLPNYNIDRASRVDLDLAVVKESLSLCACFEESGQCDIWVMREYGVVESWTKQFTIVLPEAGIQRYFGIPKNNVVLLQTRSGELVSYDLGILQCKNLGICVSLCSSNVFPVVETLVLLQGICSSGSANREL